MFLTFVFFTGSSFLHWVRSPGEPTDCRSFPLRDRLWESHREWHWDHASLQEHAEKQSDCRAQHHSEPPAPWGRGRRVQCALRLLDHGAYQCKTLNRCTHAGERYLIRYFISLLKMTIVQKVNIICAPPAARAHCSPVPDVSGAADPMLPQQQSSSFGQRWTSNGEPAGGWGPRRGAEGTRSWR